MAIMARPEEALNREEAFTQEGLLGEILLRLPAADIHRFRYVNRMWLRVVGDEGLIAQHRQRRARKPLFFYQRDFGESDHVDGELVAIDDLQAIDVAARECSQVLRFPDDLDTINEANDLGEGLGSDKSDSEVLAAITEAEHMFTIEGSCDGILLISCVDCLYACNPCTSHWARLPPIHMSNGIIGFYATEAKKEQERVYRVLYQTGAQSNQASYWIRDLGAAPQDAVTEIGRRMSPGMPHDLGEVLLAGLYPARTEPPTMLHRRLHWLPQRYLSQQIDFIVVLDTAALEFRSMRPPDIPAAELEDLAEVEDEDEPVWDPPGGARQLFEMEGMLAMAFLNREGTAIDVWVLRDYAKEAWERKYKINLPDNDGHAPFYGPRPPACVASRKLDVLLWCQHAVLHSDAKGNLLKRYFRPHHETISTPHVLEESFALRAFLSAHVNDGEISLFQF